MSKMSLNFQVDSFDVLKMVRQMPMNAKISLLRELEQETWAERFDKAVGGIRKGLQKLSDKEMNNIIEDTRQRLYNERVQKRAKSNN